MTLLWLPTVVTVIALIGLRPRPTVAWAVQSDLENAFRVRPLSRLRTLVVRIAARRGVDRFAALSTAHLHRTSAFLGVDSSEFALIPNCARQLGPIEAAHRDGSVVQVVCVARLHPQKDLHVLLEAMHRLPHDLIACDILGDGPERAALEALASDLGLDNVRLVGFRFDVATWLQRADVFVLPSRWEPFGVAVVEAMSCGLAVVATRTDGPSEVITDGEDGLLVDVGDADGLARAIRRLATDPQERSRLGRAAAKTASRYSPERIARAYATWLGQGNHAQIG